MDLDEVRAALREAQDGTDRVKRITRDLKVFARGDEDRISAIEVRPVFESAPVAPVAALAPIARRRILAIDDEPLLATCYSRMLRAEHDVVTATDAREALARITRGERFDVIFCDLMMPVMGGMEFYAAVKALTPELLDRIVFVTGGAFTLVAREFLEGVSNLRLEKPFEMSTLKAVVHDRAK